MRSQEKKVSPLSDYYIYAPSTLAHKLFLYPLIIGNFIYEPDYHIHRNSYDSFLIIYITKGSCDVLTEGCSYTANAGQFVFLDCYVPHEYGSEKAWEAAWLHFDGPIARSYFEEIKSRYGHVLTPDKPEKLVQVIEQIINLFRESSPIVEASISSYITKLLNGLMVSASDKKRASAHASTISDVITYINEHFHENITVESLAKRAQLSQYHFIRVFTRETGFTPYNYLIVTRIIAAKFLLNSTESTVKNIAFSTGFNSESSFCSTFKKWEGITPLEYKESILS